ncbi:MAG: hypothetical protein HY246_02470 [Proteobacteria bacterium]|nr:hypothetical protein [Pseudomonadota bacterium]
MTIRRHLLACAMTAALGLLWAGCSAGSAAEKQKHHFMVLSNATPGQENRLVEWYSGQHFHDLLNIEGVTAAQFFKLSAPQYREGQPHPLQYLVIWEIETDDLAAVFARVQKGLATGTTVRSDAMDGPTSTNNTFTPVTKRITAEDVRGKSVAEVLSLSRLAK